jgi:hypothetical protein
MTFPSTELVATAKGRIGEWIHEMQVGGSHLPETTREQLLTQLASAHLVPGLDGSLELVLPALSSLGVGIFQRSFNCEAVRVRVVPYGAC